MDPQRRNIFADAPTPTTCNAWKVARTVVDFDDDNVSIGVVITSKMVVVVVVSITNDILLRSGLDDNQFPRYTACHIHTWCDTARHSIKAIKNTHYEKIW